MGRNTKKGEKHVCLQCMELHLKGKREKRFIGISRIDPSSIKRHKERWHNLPDNKPCTIVPMTAPEVALLADKYANMKLTKDGTRNKPLLIRHAESLSNAQPFPLDDNIINEDNDSSEFELQELTDAETNEGLLDPNEPLNPCESLDDVLPKDSLSPKNGSLNQESNNTTQFCKVRNHRL